MQCYPQLRLGIRVEGSSADNPQTTAKKVIWGPTVPMRWATSGAVSAGLAQAATAQQVATLYAPTPLEAYAMMLDQQGPGGYTITTAGSTVLPSAARNNTKPFGS